MIKIILAAQFAFFLYAGTLTVRHQVREAEVRATAAVLIQITPQQLTELRL